MVAVKGVEWAETEVLGLVAAAGYVATE